MMSFAQTLSRLGFLFARSRDGMSQEEAKKLFFQFRQKRVGPSSEGEPEGPAPGEETISRQMESFMRDTTQKLDRIEADIEYLKTQVDKILKKI